MTSLTGVQIQRGIRRVLVTGLLNQSIRFAPTDVYLEAGQGTLENPHAIKARKLPSTLAAATDQQVIPSEAIG